MYFVVTQIVLLIIVRVMSVPLVEFSMGGGLRLIVKKVPKQELKKMGLL